jgi:hypothetical protein
VNADRWVAYSLRAGDVNKGINRFEVTLSKDAKKGAVLQDVVLVVRPGQGK